MPSRHLPILPVLATLLAVAGCRDAEIATYRVPKEAPPPAAVNATSADPHAGLGIPPVEAGPLPLPADMASTEVPTASGADLAWTAPAGWQSRPASTMRKATYIIPGQTGEENAELAVTAFPGDVGGNLANLNRWRQQLGLPPIAASQLGAALHHVHAGGLHIDVAELLGPAPSDGQARQRVLGAIVPHQGSTWFFKLTGPDALVSREKQTFLDFIQTLRPAG